MKSSKMGIDRIDKLNDDCLLHIFKCCDLPTLVELSFTCKKFNEILHCNVFPNCKSFSIHKTSLGYVDNCYQPRRTQKLYGSLRVVRKILKCIGAYLVEIHIDWTSSSHAISRMNIIRLFRTINDYAGVNIRTLEIGTRGVDVVKESHLQEIRPILNRLQTLKLNFYSSINFDLQSFCPDLRKLEILFYSSWANCITWPSLSRLSILQSHMPFISLTRFLLNNPQLKKLKYSSMERNKNVLEVISQSLDSIERLSIGIDRGIQDDIGTADFYPSGLRQIAVKHKNLKKLCLFEISQSEVSGVCESLQLYENLIGLKLTFYGIRCQYVNVDAAAFRTIMQKMTKLETLMIGYAKLDESIIMNLVRYGSLKELHLHMCTMPPLSELLLDRLAKIEEDKKTGQQIWTIAPLKLYVDDEDYEIIEEKKSRPYLSVHHGCDHSEIW